MGKALVDGIRAPYAILMAGQLSERAGMGVPLRGCPGFAEHVAEFDALTDHHFGRLLTEASQEELSFKFTAPSVMVLYNVLCGEIARRRFGPPAAVAGYSLGYYGAAILAGCMAPRTALEWVKRVNDCNRKTIREGDFRIVVITGLSAEAFRAHVRERGLEGVEIADINNPRQIVAAGPRAVMERAIESLAGIVLDARPVPLDIPLHTPHLLEAARAVAPWWEGVEAANPSLPLLSPVDGHVIEDEADFQRDMLASLTSPTHFLAVVERLRAMGISRVLDTSPSGELGRMARWTCRDLEVLPISSLAEGVV